MAWVFWGFYTYQGVMTPPAAAFLESLSQKNIPGNVYFKRFIEM
jgi:hypothetical protein